MKERFENLLRSTGREGVETVLKNLEKLGFFKAPASTMFHLSREGGLLEHSLNVCEMALSLREVMIAKDPSLEAKLPLKSVIVVSLLHDCCKAEVYKKSLRNKKIDGVWHEVEVYEVDYNACPLGHGEKSVIRLLKWGFDLTEDEILAIRWHMGPWDLAFQSAEMKGNINAAREKSPLCVLLQCADGLSSGIIEAAN